MQTRYSNLLKANLPAEAFTRKALSLLEAQLREMALLMLQDWSNTGISTKDSSRLLQAIAGLQQPAWGNWNFLIDTLRHLYNNQFEIADKATQKKLEQATTLDHLLQLLERNSKTVDNKAWIITLYKLKKQKPAKRGVSLQKLLSDIPIALRNEIAHNSPEEATYWQNTATALKPLIQWLATQTEISVLAHYPHQAPWFFKTEQEDLHYNGIAKKNDVIIYVGENGIPQPHQSPLRDIFIHFQTLFGKTEEQVTDFRKLIKKYTPEKLKGVLMGDFLVGRFIGEGAYGRVHKGRQLSTGRQVAIKLLRDEANDIDSVRFKLEAELLSRLNHPNIVDIISYGEDIWYTPRNNSPKGETWYKEFKKGTVHKTYIAMEWIEGQTLDDYYQQQIQQKQTPDLEQLTQWFVDISDALVDVHKANVIHRDIKPSNLMITATGVIKLLDFGIARSFNPQDVLMLTQKDERLGTIAYMAPEQIAVKNAKRNIGKAADIYGLCAVFYELYTQQRLYQHDKENIDKQTISANKLKGIAPQEPIKIKKNIPWEINIILMAGLETVLSDRYDNMKSLKQDLIHYNKSEPIEYTRPSIWRRTFLGYKRNMQISNMTALSLLLIMGLTFGYFYKLQQEQQKTQQERDQAIDLVKYMSYELRDILRPIGKLYIMDNVQQRINQYFEHIRLEESDDDTLREKGIGLLQYADTLLTLGKTDKAEIHYQKAHQIFKKLVENNPKKTALQSSLAVSFIKLGIKYQDQGEPEKALTAYQTALKLAQKIQQQEPENKQWQFGVASSASYLSDFYQQQGELSKSLENAQITHKLIKKLVKNNQEDKKLQRDLSVSFENIADIYQEQGNIKNALDLYKESKKIINELIEDEPNNIQPLSDLAAILNKIGDMHEALEEVDKAQAIYQRALEIGKKLNKIDPENTQWLSNLSVSLNKVASFYLRENEIPVAIKQYQESLEIRRKLVQINPKQIQWKNDLATSYIFIGNLYKQQDKTAKALEAYQSALLIGEQLIKFDPKNTSILYVLSSVYSYIGDIHEQEKQISKALNAYKKALEYDKKLVETSPNNQHAQRNLAVSFSKLGDMSVKNKNIKMAIDWYLRSKKIIEKLAKENPNTTQYSLDKVEYYYKLSCLINKKKKEYIQMAGSILNKMTELGKLSQEEINYFKKLKKNLGNLVCNFSKKIYY